MVDASEEVEENSLFRSKRYFLTPWEASPFAPPRGSKGSDDDQQRGSRVVAL